MHSLLVKVASLRVTGIPNSILVSVHWLLSSAKFLSNFEGKWLKASVWIQTQVFQMRWLMLCHRSNCISVENKSWQDVVSLESLGIKDCVFWKILSKSFDVYKNRKLRNFDGEKHFGWKFRRISRSRTQTRNLFCFSRSLQPKNFEFRLQDRVSKTCSTSYSF